MERTAQSRLGHPALRGKGVALGRVDLSAPLEVETPEAAADGCAGHRTHRPRPALSSDSAPKYLPRAWAAGRRRALAEAAGALRTEL